VVAPPARTALTQVSAAEGIDIDPMTVLTAVFVLVVAYTVARLLSLSLTAIADRVAQHRFRVTLLIPLLKFAVYGTAL